VTFLSEFLLVQWSALRITTLSCLKRPKERLYQSGLAMTDAQRKVKEFSSAKYTSHRCIPEVVAHAMD
jgi:hypothetical protein